MRNRCKDYSDFNEDEEDFEDSSDEYKPLESSSSESEIEEETMNISLSDDEAATKTHNVQRCVKKSLQSIKTRFPTRHQDDFVFESDKYFGQANRKVKRPLNNKKIQNLIFG